MRGNSFDYHLLVVNRYERLAAHLAVCSDLRIFNALEIEQAGDLDTLCDHLANADTALSARWPALHRSIKALAQGQRRPCAVGTEARTGAPQ